MALCGELRQSTAVDILLGPFVDSTDGKTAETGLTLDVEVSKNGQALANKNDATVPVHDAAGDVDGYYNCELDATDTGTLGTLTVVAHDAGALPVRQDYNIVSQQYWDSKYSTDKLQVDAVEISGDSTAADNLETMLDGTGGQTLKLGSLVVSGTAAGGVVDIDNAGGPGVKIDGTTFGLDVDASAGTGAQITSSGGNGAGLDIAGNGTGHGLQAKGGATGTGILGYGGSTSGVGIYALADGQGQGFAAVGMDNNAGLAAYGNGTGAGMLLTGGATGHGLAALGGATSGDGINAQGQTAGDGITAVGAGASQYDINADIQGGLSGAVGSVTGNVGGNVIGSVGSVTGAVGSVTGNVGGNVVGSVGSLTGHTVQTGDNYARLGAPAGGSVSADIAAVKAETASILDDTDLIDDGTSGLAKIATDVAATLVDTGTTLPATLTTIDTVVDAIKVITDALTAAAAAKLALSAAGIVSGAAEAGTLSTTEMTTDLTEATDDHYIGRVVVWTSGVLAGQASDITDYTGATGKLEYTAVTEAPGIGDTFVIY